MMRWTGSAAAGNAAIRAMLVCLGTSDPESFPLLPEGFVPDFDIDSYPLTAQALVDAP